MSETDLWCAVLHLAIQDALVGSKTNGSKQTKIRDTYEVRNYLTKPNADFNQVCVMADLDPVAVREAMIKQIAAAPTPETLFDANNTRKRQLTFEGETLTISEWSKRTGISEPLISYRLKSGWHAKRILTEPARPKKRRGVVHVFEGALGTGGGTAAQDSPNLTFQMEPTS
jgi:hypothetical protein